MTRYNPIRWRFPARFAFFAIVGIYASPAMGQKADASLQPTAAKQPTATFESKPASIPTTYAPTAETKRLLVFHLLHGDATDIANIIAGTLLEDKNTRVAVDKRINAILIYASEDQLQLARTLIQSLDVPKPEPKPSLTPIDVRLIWLAEGDAGAAKPADDLKGVVEELHRLGLNDVRQVAQTMVKSQLNGRKFHVSCSPLLEGKPTQLTTEGMIMDMKDLTMQIHISVSRSDKPGTAGDKLVGIDLNTVTEENQYLVLGVAPIGKITSIFVIQVIPAPLPAAAPPVKVFAPPR
jgi:hypothetical protein